MGNTLPSPMSHPRSELLTATQRSHVTLPDLRGLLFHPRELCLSSLAIIVAGGGVFAGLARGGAHLLRRVEEREKAAFTQYGSAEIGNSGRTVPVLPA